MVTAQFGTLMTHPDHPNDVHLSRIPTGAICQELTERLSLALGPASVELPPALLALIGQLAKGKSTTAAEIVPD
jgi:hypothetical protein